MTVAWRSSEPATAPSIYFTAAYGRAAGLTTDASWASIRSDDDAWQVPLTIRPIADGGQDASTPYGYAGIYSAAPIDQEVATDAWRSTLTLLEDAGIVSVFLRTSPFWPGQAESLAALEGLRVVKLSETVEVAVDDLDHAWSALEGRARTAVRKAEKLGFTATVGAATTALTDPTNAFRQLYDGTMERVRAAAHHRHPDAYYDLLVAGAGERLQVVEVRDAEGRVVAACLLLVDEDVVHYHLSGSDYEAARLGANNLMIWTMLRWASESGRPRVHLGGGTGPDDSLFRFKRSFGGVIRDFHVGQVVVRPDEYERLVEQQAARCGQDPAALTSSTFFPAYRGS